MKPPKHLSDELKAIWNEILPSYDEGTPPIILETICSLIQTLRQSRILIKKDGVIVRDGKNNAVEHPALGTERATITKINDMTRKWMNITRRRNV